MASTATSLKMSQLLKRRINRLAKKAEQPPHAFMLRTLEEQVTAQEARQKFYDDAEQALLDSRKRGYGYDLDGVEKHLLGKIAGHKQAPPKKTKWR